MLELKQPMARLTLVECNANWTNQVPILKYTLLVGASLLALIIVAGHVLEPTSVDAAAQRSSASSLDLLRKMANHGGNRPIASAAAAGPFLAMPAIAALPAVVAIETSVAVKPATIAVSSPSALDAQARVAEADVSDKAKPSKKIASRKPKPRLAYVEDGQRGPGGFFGTFQSW